MIGRFPFARLAGLAVVLALHAAALWGLWQHRLPSAPPQTPTLFVDFIAPPLPEKRQVPKPAPPSRPRPLAEAPPPRLLAAAPLTAATEPASPPPEPAPPQAAAVGEAPPAPAPAAPMTLSTELAVRCPERTAPAYPSLSRRLGEEGTVVLQVELDEQGAVASAHVHRSCGFRRLEEAALAVVRSWRCRPAERDGRPVRAVALQPFKFVLQEY